jgi:hypothetical protein
MSDQAAVLLFVALGSAILLGIAFWAESKASKEAEVHQKGLACPDAARAGRSTI